MAKGDYSPNFQVYLQQKDLRLALQLADDLVPAPISAAANGQYIRARQMGYADKDFAAVRAAYDAEVTQRRGESGGGVRVGGEGGTIVSGGEGVKGVSRAFRVDTRVYYGGVRMTIRGVP